MTISTESYTCDACGATWDIEWRRCPATGEWICVSSADTVGDFEPATCPSCGHDGNEDD